MHLLDEVPQHLLGDVEVGDHAVLQRADRGDRARRATEHPLRLDADGVHLAGSLVDGDDGGLGEHDAAAADVHERVGRAEVHGHVAAAEAAQIVEEPHKLESSAPTSSAAILGREHQARGRTRPQQGCCLAKGEGGLWRRVIAGQKPTVAGRGTVQPKPYTPEKRSASRRTSSAAGSPTTLR